MSTRRWFGLLLVVSLSCPLVARADESKYETGPDGVTYLVTKRTVQRPISETRYEDRQQTVYVEQLQTQIVPSQRTTWAPVVEYVTEPYVANRWNPFGTPYLSYRTVPHLRWEARNEQLQIPVVQRQVVPQQQTVKVPVVTPRFATEEYTSKVAVGTAAGTGAVAGGAGNSGATQLDSDPPRGSTAWRPSDPSQVSK
jgi:hypothetical protein